MSDTTSGLRWGRILLAGLLAEVTTIIIIVLIVTIYDFTVGAGQTEAQRQAFAGQAGYYVAPLAGAVATFLFALWVGRKAQMRIVLHGMLVSVVATLLSVGFLVAAPPQTRTMYIASYVLKLLSGYAGGLVAKK